jgi:CrcB protein
MEPLRVLRLVALLGGFTTFSSYTSDTLAMIETGERALALAYILASNGLGIAGARLAQWSADRGVVGAN